MRINASIAICCLTTLSMIAASVGQDAPRLLILLDTLEMQQTHSKYLQTVSRGHEVEIATINSDTIKLKDWDMWNYEKLVIIGGKSGLGPGFRPSIIADYYADGRSLVLLLSSDASNELRSLAKDLGITVAPTKTAVIDHFNVAGELDTPGDHTAVLTSSLASLPAVFRQGTKGPVVFRGVGLSVPHDSETAFPALTGSKTAYSGAPGGPPPAGGVLAGESLALVALVQGRNNARAAVLGSTEMCSDAFIAAASGNAGVCTDVSEWGLGMRGMLKVSALRHRILEGSKPGVENPSAYRINDDVEIAFDVEECGAEGCRAFLADDMQAEFVMLDPYLRISLETNGNGTFSARAKVPDVYGVFKWVVDYRRPGLSWVHLVETVPVRPYRHDEYERFILQAYPYYASAAAMMAAFFVLSFVSSK